MSQSVAGQAEVIIIDGGIVVGCSIAYHLAELGVSEVLVLGAQETDFPYDLAHCGSRYTAELFHHRSTGWLPLCGVSRCCTQR